MKYFEKPISKGTKVGYVILSTIKSALILGNAKDYIESSKNPYLWPAIAIDFIVTADLILTAYSGRVLPITTTIIGNLPYGKTLLKKVEDFYDFLLGVDETDSHKPCVGAGI